METPQKYLKVITTFEKERKCFFKPGKTRTRMKETGFELFESP